MIPPVSFGAGPPAAATHPPPDVLLRQSQAPARAPRTAAESGQTRVDLSAEGVAQSRAEAAPQAAAQDAAEIMLLARPGLSFAKADANEDGVVTLPEEHAYETRHLQATRPQAAAAGPGGESSEPLRAYRSIAATPAGI